MNKQCIRRLAYELFERIVVVCRNNEFDKTFLNSTDVQIEYLNSDYPGTGVLYKTIEADLIENWVVICDLGLGHDIADVKQIVFYLHQGHRLAIGSRFLPEGERYRNSVGIALRGLGNRLITLLLNLAYHGNFVDSFQRFRGFTNGLLRERDISSHRLEHYRQCIHCIKLGHRYIEFPTKEQRVVDPVNIFSAMYNALFCIWVLITEKFIKSA